MKLDNCEENNLQIKLCKPNTGPTFIYKQLRTIISPIIIIILLLYYYYKLFNLSVCEAIFPSILEVAKISPIPRSNKYDQLNNYRPISILPTLFKIYEKLMKIHLHNYIEKYKIINQKQFEIFFKF